MKLPMKINRIAFRLLVLLTAFLAGCSANNGYKTAHKFFANKNYVTAITLYDNYLETAINGAVATNAQLERSECYYQLGQQAYAKENWVLASRLFFLANSPQSDNYADNVLYQLAQNAFAAADTVTTLDYYSQILTQLPASELVPHILYDRFHIYIEQDAQNRAFDDFSQLWNEFHTNEFTQKAQPELDTLLPWFIDKAAATLQRGHFQDALDTLFVLEEYTVKHTSQIRFLISDTYEAIAEDAYSKKDMHLVRSSIANAVKYNSAKEQKMQTRIEGICDGFVQCGEKELKNFKTAAAIQCYTHCFALIPHYGPAEAGIVAAQTLQKKMDDSDLLNVQASKQEDEENYQAALELYQRSYRLIPAGETKQKIFVMKNLLRAQENPKDFAISILENYKSGKVMAAIFALERELRLTYSDELTTSGWRVLYAFGDYRYEVRYDLLTPADNYYFIWRVNLADQTVIPLNKSTENILEEKTEKP